MSPSDFVSEVRALFRPVTIPPTRGSVSVVILHDDVDCQIIKRGRFRQRVEPVTQAKYSTDRRIDAYIKSLPSWQQTVCQQVRDVVHAADPDVVETIKRTRLPYFTLNGNICALLAAKAHVNIFIYDPIAPDPDDIINQGQANATARSIQIREGEQIRKRSLLRLFKAVIANNRAGGWRRVGQAR